MPKQKEFQLSGAEKRRLSKVKPDKERSTVAKGQCLDRFLVPSSLSETDSETETVTVATMLSTSTFPYGSENFESAHISNHTSPTSTTVNQSQWIINVSAHFHCFAV